MIFGGIGLIIVGANSLATSQTQGQFGFWIAGIGLGCLILMIGIISGIAVKAKSWWHHG